MCTARSEAKSPFRQKMPATSEPFAQMPHPKCDFSVILVPIRDFFKGSTVVNSWLTGRSSEGAKASPPYFDSFRGKRSALPLKSIADRRSRQATRIVPIGRIPNENVNRIISVPPKRARRANQVEKVQSFYDVHRVPPIQNWPILKRFGHFFVRLSRGRSHSNFNDLFPSSVNSAVPSFSHL